MSVDPMQKFGKENMDMAMNAFGAWAKNAQAIATEVADYSKKSFEDSAAAFESSSAPGAWKRPWKCRPRICDRHKPFEGVRMKMPGTK